MNNKISKEECEFLMQGNCIQINNVADDLYEKFERFNEAERKNSNDIDAIKSEMKNRVHSDNFESSLKHYENIQKDLEMALAGVQNDFLNFSEKMTLKLDSFHEKKNKLHSSNEIIKKKLASLDKSHFHHYTEVQKSLEAYQLYHDKLNVKVENILKSLEDYSKDLSTHTISINDLIISKANKAEIYSNEQLNEITQQLSIKIDSEEFYNSFQQLTSSLSEKLPLTVFEKFIISFDESLEKIKKDVILKGNIKDICILLDTKANIDDVNHALTEIHNELDSKTGESEFNRYVIDQRNAKCMTNTDNVVGRWH